MEDREIAMNILLKALDNHMVAPQSPEVETIVDAICAAYKQIHKAVLEG